MDPQKIEWVGEQLSVLVKQLLGAKSVLPDPFTMVQQLSDFGVPVAVQAPPPEDTVDFSALSGLTV